VTNQLRHRSGGPRPDITAEPLELSDLGTTRASRAITFIENYVIFPSGKGARRRFRLRPGQKPVLSVCGISAEGREGRLLIRPSPRNRLRLRKCR
jgi:hypothetical protein